MDFVQRMYEMCVSFYSEEGVRKMLDFFMPTGETASLAEDGRMILVWVAVFVVIGFLVDQVLYWTRPDHRSMMVRPWRLVARWIRTIREKTNASGIGDTDEQN